MGHPFASSSRVWSGPGGYRICTFRMPRDAGCVKVKSAPVRAAASRRKTCKLRRGEVGHDRIHVWTRANHVLGMNQTGA